jgi:[ribosomal protein S18]-alanine N-acetyltransferase
MLAMDVRTADIRDLPGLLRIEEECFGVEMFSADTVRSFIERDDTFVIVAIEGKDVVGSAMCMISEERQEGRIASIAVLPGSRRKGTGVRLLEECERKLLRFGLEISTLEVDVANDAAIALYESKGYEINGMIRDFYGPGRDAYVMQKPLYPEKTEISVRTS